MSCETKINNKIETLDKLNENSQPKESKDANLDENSLETLTECFQRMNVKPDLKMEPDMEPKRKVLVLDLDETLAHTKYGQKYRDPEKKYKLPQSENPPNFVFTVSLS